MNKIRVRYAPSPTGYLHIGGARSALFNYLFAKHHHGDFILRIEDTDVARNIPGAIESQTNDLKWLGIIPDESMDNPNPECGPYRQMEKLDIYQKYCDYLLEKGYAYECFCSAEDLAKSKEEQLARGISSPRYDRRCLRLSLEEKEELKAKGIKPAIRLKMPHNEILEFDDMVRGKMSFKSDDIGDFVIMKSNGVPTYNFAVVIDDYMMKISHVLRGEEHLSNTPKQLQIYKYLGIEPPVFGHLSIITNEAGKKLSKRDHDIRQFIAEYRKAGYLKEAIFNFLFLLGFSPEGENEIYSKDEAIKIFDVNHLSSAPSMFDNKKLNWMNAHYIKNMSSDDYLKFVKNFVLDEYRIISPDKLDYLLLLFQPEIKAASEVNKLLDEIYHPHPLNDEQLAFLNLDSSKIVLNKFKEKVEKLANFSKENVNALFKEIMNETSLKGKFVYLPVRLKLTGLEHGLEIYNILYALGKEEIYCRISTN